MECHITQSTSDYSNSVGYYFKCEVLQYNPFLHLETGISSPWTIYSLPSPPKRSTALDFCQIASFFLASTSTPHFARPCGWALALVDVDKRVGGESSLRCDRSRQESGLTKEDFLLWQVCRGTQVGHLGLSAAAKLGAGAATSHSKVGTDSTVAPVVSFSDPKKSGFPPEWTPRVFHLPE